MEGRNKGLVILGIILLAIGLFASFYQVRQLVGQPPALVEWQIVTPYQNVGIVLDVAGIIFLAFGLLYPLRKTLPPPLSNPQQQNSCCGSRTLTSLLSISTSKQ